jgi:hypothetical protein
MIRNGYPFVRVQWIFDLTVRFANCTSDPWGRLVDVIVQRPEKIAVCVDAVSRLITDASLGWDWLFVSRCVTQEEPGVRERREEESVQRKTFL